MTFSRHDHPLSSAHCHTSERCLLLPTDLLFHSSPTLTLNLYIFFCLSAMLHILLSPWIFLSFIIFPSLFLSGSMLHFHAVLLALHITYEQPLSAFDLPYINSPHSLSLTHRILFWLSQHPYVLHLQSLCLNDM